MAEKTSSSPWRYENMSRRRQLGFWAFMGVLLTFIAVTIAVGTSADREAAVSGEYASAYGTVDSVRSARTGAYTRGTLCDVRFDSGAGVVSDTMRCPEATQVGETVTVYFRADRIEESTLSTPEETASDLTVGRWMMGTAGLAVAGLLLPQVVRAWRRPKKDEI